MNGISYEPDPEMFAGKRSILIERVLHEGREIDILIDEQGSIAGLGEGLGKTCRSRAFGQSLDFINLYKGLI